MRGLGLLCAVVWTALTVAACGRIGYELLDPQAIEVDGVSRPACSVPCQNAHGSAMCADGVCTLACSLGYADCNGDPSDGCETSLALGGSTCGSCALSCRNDHGDSLCSDGICLPTCEAGYADCDSDPQNGCETGLGDVGTCGDCSTRCTNNHGVTRCTLGACVPECDTGYADCDGMPSNGCESDLALSPFHCGQCGLGCNQDEMCIEGSCVAAECPSGLGECRWTGELDCETDLQSSQAHCGYCGAGCAAERGRAECVLGGCEVTDCDEGFGDCDGEAATGCESDLAKAVDHCGSCGANCQNDHGSTRCLAGVCQPTCDFDHDDCDGEPDNGCETALDSPEHCGQCGRSCPANGGTPVCQAGLCSTTCDLSGTFALQIDVGVLWGAAPYILEGVGQFRLWLQVNATQNGNDVDVSIRECGRQVPPFFARLVPERYGFGYPNSLFDSGRLPAVQSTMALAGRAPDAPLSLPEVTTLMGLAMEGADTDPWPATAAGIPAAQRVDMDGDGYPGVSAFYKDGGLYQYPRTSIQAVGERADTPYAASRLAFSMAGNLTSCSGASGVAMVTHIDTRIFGASRANSDVQCTSTEAQFLDDNIPTFVPQAGTFRLLKIDSGGGCPAVRAAVP